MEISKIFKRFFAFVKKYRFVILMGFLVIYCMVVFWIIPMKESLTPHISQMEGKLYVGEGVTPPEYGINFWGENLDNVDAVYLDGVKCEVCEIPSAESTRVVLRIPEKLYEKKEAFSIQLSKRYGGIFLFKGNAFQVQVSAYTDGRPEISGVSRDTIYGGKGIQKVILNVKNCERGAVLYINEENMGKVNILDNDIVELYISPDMYRDSDSIRMMLGSDLGGGQAVYSNIAEIAIETMDYSQVECSYSMAEENRLIMHAAGMWDGYTYTNCLEAFQENYEKGCRAFEVGLAVTSDDVIVGRHDWSTVMYQSSLVAEDELRLEGYKRNNLPKTYEELCHMYEGRTPLTWTALLDYLASDEGLYIITDTKYGNEAAVKYVFGKMVEEARQQNREDVLDRVVVQIYNQDMYKDILDIYPFPSVIYTLYASPDSREEILELVNHSNLRIIALPRDSIWDDDAFFRELIEKGCYIYVHTINDLDQAAKYIARGCRGVYTDKITPEHFPDLEEKVAAEKERRAKEEAVVPEGTDSAGLTGEELEFRKRYLIHYLEEIKNEDYLVLMCVQDEATAGVDDDIAEALTELGVSERFRDAYRQSYVGILSGGNAIYEAFSEELLEYTYVEGETVFQLKSAGNGVEAIAGIAVDGNDGNKEQALHRGLHITVYNKKLGIVQDRIVFDLYEGLGHTGY